MHTSGCGGGSLILGAGQKEGRGGCGIQMAQVWGLQGALEVLRLTRGEAHSGEFTASGIEQQRKLLVLGVSGFPRPLLLSRISNPLLTASACSPCSPPSSFRKCVDSGATRGRRAAATSSSERSLLNDYYSGSMDVLSWPSSSRNLKAASSSRRVQRLCLFDDKNNSDGTSSSSSGRSEDHHRQELLQPYGIPAISVPDRWDVVGLGQAMVDFSASVGDGFLQGLGLIKGTRKVVNHEERGQVLQALDGCSYKVTAGGSLSNTLVALARLGTGYNGDPPLNVAMTGSVGSDALGDFYRTKLLRANVHFLSQPIADGTTGTVIVCTTPDAQRTMLSYQGMSSTINFDEALEKQISMSRVLVVEGYLWELSETIETIARACKKAREHGVLVALTASDISCVNRHREKMWDVMAESADMLFTNADEARALLGCDSSISPAIAAKLLSRHCPLVSVTDGARGSYIGLKGEMSYIQPAVCLPVDTCGAGDAYAAGVLYGLLKGVPNLKGVGNLAARVAAVVVGQQGTRLKEEDARELATSVHTIPSSLEGLNLSLNTQTEQSVNA